MRETYFTFARWTALVSIVMWAIALAFSVGRVSDQGGANRAATNAGSFI